MPELSKRALDDAIKLTKRIEKILAREVDDHDPPAQPQRDDSTWFITSQLKRRGRDWVTILAVLAITVGVANLMVLLLHIG